MPRTTTISVAVAVGSAIGDLVAVREGKQRRVTSRGSRNFFTPHPLPTSPTDGAGVHRLVRVGPGPGSRRALSGGYRVIERRQPGPLV